MRKLTDAEAQCQAPNCHRRRHDGDLCNAHHRMAQQGLSLEYDSVFVARRMAKVHKADSGCWEWQGGRNRSGYGRTGTGTVGETGAHRWFYQHLVGPIPEGLVLDHLCRNPACVNLAHLEPVTVLENTR